jgi:hypothetical protein
MGKAIEVLHEDLFTEVTREFNLEAYSLGEINRDLSTRNVLKKVLGVNVEQIGFYDFVDLAYPEANRFFCLFQRGKEVNKNYFVKRKEMKERLYNVFKYAAKTNTYISYSTYVSSKKEYITVPKRIKFPDGSYAKACDLKTKNEYYITTKTKKLKPRRTQSNIHYTYLLVQDLDYYKLGVTDDEAVKRIAKLISNDKIICPNFFLFTGNGIQLVWSVQPFKNIKGYTHDKEWRAVQEYMIHLFNNEGLNADTVVKNPSAVTRVAESYNRNAEKIVRAFYTNAAQLNLYDFVWKHGLHPLPDKKVAAPKKQKPTKVLRFPVPTEKEEELEQLNGVNKRRLEKQEDYHVTEQILLKKQWDLQTLNEARLDDLFTYVKVCKDRGIPLTAKRNWLALVVAFYSLVGTNGDSEVAQQKVIELWDMLPNQNDTSLGEIMRRGYEEAVKVYNDWIEGTWDKSKYVQPGLFYNTSTLLNIMGIKEDYAFQHKMKTIKRRNKEYEAFRKRVERRAKGVEEREVYLKKEREQTEDKLHQLRILLERNPKATQKKLADIMGVNQSTISRLKKQL